jgi:hypothetical protein
MNMAAKTCQICGKPSGIYPLCVEHLKMKSDGLVVKNEAGNWVLKETTPTPSTPKAAPNPPKSPSKPVESKPNEPASTTSSCIICSSPSNGKPLCTSCYRETNERKDEFDRNQKPYELRDYYFNLRSNIYRITNFEYVKDNSKKLFALAYLVNDIHKDSSLINRVVDDVKDIIEKKTPQKNAVPTKYTEQSDSQKASIIRTVDGHIVKSAGESIIDDILYNNKICHCYEKDVYELGTDERSIKSDWFIPVYGNKGIYVEYWGMDSEEYKRNKDEKKKLYKDYGIPLIQIEKDDTKDVSGLTSRILREYETLKNEIKKQL